MLQEVVNAVIKAFYHGDIDTAAYNAEFNLGNSCSSHNIKVTGQADPVHVTKPYGGADI